MIERGLKIYHVNTRSIYNKITLLQSLYSDIDILCCSETWLDNRITDRLVNINNKKIYRCDRHDKINDYNKRVSGGGVCIYVGTPYMHFTEKDIDYSKITPDFEILTLTITKPNFRNLLVICVYKPPSGKVEKCIEFLKQIVSNPRFAKREIWILGDFNVDILKRDDANVILLQGFVKKAGLCQKINTLTRPNRNGGSCIDLIMTNCLFVKVSGTLDDFVSDHYTIYCIRKKAKENKECVYKTFRNYNRYNQENFEALLRGKNWAFFDSLIDPNHQWDFILKVTTEILSVMCPYQKRAVRKTATPWLTPDIFNQIHDKRNLVKRYKQTGDQVLLREIRILRNNLNAKIDKAKSKYIIENLRRNCKNPKKFWRIINDFIHPDNTSDPSTVNFIDLISGDPIDQKEVPNYLNNFFANIAEKTCDHTKVKYPIREGNQDIHFDFEPPELGDLMYIIREIDSDMSSCIDGLNMKMCKRLITAIPEKFCLIYANSMYYGVFPSDWAIATVTLLPKTGDKTNPGNWRPISNTNIFAKILEILVHKQVSQYIYANNLISEQQYGFVPGRSTHESIFKFTKHIYSAINNGKITGVLFLHIAKAFNCINHEILDIFMANNGFDNRVRKWFKSYNTRLQCVKINENRSDIKRVLYGAAQGTVLGPTLFILYFNAITENVSRCKISMFADDCIIYQSGNTWESVREKLQYDLDNILEWTTKHSLALNVSKTQAMVLGPRNKTRRLQLDIPVYMSNNPIKFVTQYNYLGIILDSEMTMQPMLKHINSSLPTRFLS